MRYSVDMEPAAINTAAGFLVDDPEGLRRLMAALDDLAVDPLPPTSTALGSELQRRIRVGRYRAIYELRESSQIVIVVIGRI
jgi:mRNA interferase RelE/StbE